MVRSMRYIYNEAATNHRSAANLESNIAAVRLYISLLAFDYARPVLLTSSENAKNCLEVSFSQLSFGVCTR